LQSAYENAVRFGDRREAEKLFQLIQQKKREQEEATAIS
jgi:hypothetical protein